MPYEAQNLGRRFGPLRWDVTPARALAFAAVLDPDDSGALDDAKAAGLEAAPTLIASPEWALSQISRRAIARLSPDEIVRGVHAIQDSAFLAPLRLGDRLVCASEVVGVREIRSGVAVTSAIIHRRATDDLVVARTRSISIFRGATLSGRPHPAPEFEGPDLLDERVSASWPKGETQIRIARGFPHLYSAAAEIWNPIHTERRAALAAGFEDIIVHGSALWAMIAKRLTPPNGGLTRLAARFRAPVVPGLSLALRWTTNGEQIRFRLSRPDGVVAVTGGAELRSH